MGSFSSSSSFHFPEAWLTAAGSKFLWAAAMFYAWRDNISVHPLQQKTKWKMDRRGLELRRDDAHGISKKDSNYCLMYERFMMCVNTGFNVETINSPGFFFLRPLTFVLERTWNFNVSGVLNKFMVFSSGRHICN